MNLLQSIRRRPDGDRAGLVALQTSQAGIPVEKIGHEFGLYVEAAYRANGVVHACITARQLLFAEARFRFRRSSDQTLFGTPALGLLERPWPNGTTRDLLSRMEQDASLHGNAYIYRAEPDMLQRLRPDWVEVVVNPDNKQKSGYLYSPGGKHSGDRPVYLAADEVAHYMPIPDPLNPWKGMTWLSTVTAEVEADKQMTRHKQKFFESAATPNLLVTVEKRIKDADAREAFRNELDRRFGGIENAYKTMILDDGADAKVVGNTFEQMSFSTVQAAGENRIAAAAGVPSIVVGLKEGLQAATYSNYEQAMRRFGEMTMHPLWGTAAGDLATVVEVPDGAELWYDATSIPALQQNALDRAEILLKKANTAGVLIRAGYQPELVAAAVGLPELPHTGKIPVTLYQDGNEPGVQSPDDQAPEGTT
jgi:HK97 family phage portal protein